MRLIDILPDSFQVSPYLMEINLFNASEVKERIVKLSKRVNSPKHRQWFQTALFKELVNQRETMDMAQYSLQVGDPDSAEVFLKDYGGLSAVKRIPKDSPHWVKDKLDKGEEIYKLSFNRYILSNVSSVIRWLNKAVGEGKSINMRWETALEKSLLWEKEKDEEKERIKKEKQEKERLRKIQGGLKVIKKYPNGYYWVYLSTPECVNDEGHRMSNCLKGRTTVFDDARHYSLRNEEDKSLVTLLVDSDIVNATDIKGKYNNVIEWDEYEYLIDFMADQDYSLADPPNSEDYDDAYEEEYFDEALDEWENIISAARRLGYDVVPEDDGMHFIKEEVI